ncbi:MAG: HEAT repeat domain-containing protein [Sandaracinaceae bacterium]|nr:HEAT repeat domain-containing protein [Sandaracinaceae bacterium]
MRRALRDTDPEVRAAASHGLAGLEDDAGDDVAAALAHALAAETEAAGRARMMVDLGRLRRDDALSAIEAAVRAEDPGERAAGCRAAAERGLAGRDAPASVRSRMAALLAADQPVEVRLACAYGFARLPPPSAEAEPQGEVVALTMASADSDPEVRVYAYRALGRQPDVPIETLLQGTRDADWRVAAQAFRALGARLVRVERGAAVYAPALDAAYGRAREGDDLTPGGPLHVLVAALEAGGPLARSSPCTTWPCASTASSESCGRAPRRPATGASRTARRRSWWTAGAPGPPAWSPAASSRSCPASAAPGPRPSSATSRGRRTPAWPSSSGCIATRTPS